MREIIVFFIWLFGIAVITADWLSNGELHKALFSTRKRGKDNWKKELKEKIEKYGKYNWSDVLGGNEKYKIEMEEIINFVQELKNKKS